MGEEGGEGEMERRAGRILPGLPPPGTGPSLGRSMFPESRVSARSGACFQAIRRVESRN